MTLSREITVWPESCAKSAAASGPSSSRAATMISLSVTPWKVGPPLPPLNAKHGGEYGSPLTCFGRPEHAETVPIFVLPPLVPPAVPPPSVAPGVPASPDATCPATIGSAEVVRRSASEKVFDSGRHTMKASRGEERPVAPGSCS